jgi:hypothetical protein
MLICPEASGAQNNIAVGFDPSLELLMQASIAFVVLALRHCLGGSRVKVK